MRINQYLIIIANLVFLVKAGSSLAENSGSYDSLSVREGVVLYHFPADKKIAGQYRQWILSFKPRPQWFDSGEVRRMKIFISPSVEEFFRLSEGRLPEWGVACAIPEQNMIIVRSPRIVPLWLENPQDILRHEISHLFLEQKLNQADIPRWFHEGFAQYSSGMWDIGNSLEYSLALLLGRISPLKGLERSFPEAEKEARWAYLQSYTAVEYLFIRWEKRHLQFFFKKWQETGDMDRAMRMSLGLTLVQYEKLWRRWAEIRYGWLKLLTSVTLVWIIAAVLFLMVYAHRRYKYKERLEQMRLGELNEVQDDQAGSEQKQQKNCAGEETKNEAEEPDIL